MFLYACKSVNLYINRKMLYKKEMLDIINGVLFEGVGTEGVDMYQITYPHFLSPFVFLSLENGIQQK